MMNLTDSFGGTTPILKRKRVSSHNDFVMFARELYEQYERLMGPSGFSNDTPHSSVDNIGGGRNPHFGEIPIDEWSGENYPDYAFAKEQVEEATENIETDYVEYAVKHLMRG